MKRATSNDKVQQLWERFFKKRSDLFLREQLASYYYFLVEVEVRRLLARLPVKVYWEKKGDLTSAGAIGLLQAMDSFVLPERQKDPNRAFEVYSRYRIRGQMLDELRNLDFAKRNLRKQIRIIRETQDKIQFVKGRPARDEEVASALSISLNEYYDRLAEINMLNLLSLDAEIALERTDGQSLVDVILDPKAENPLDKIEKQEKIEKMTVFLKRLVESEQKVLHLYYIEDLTFKEIGKVLKISESRVCQIHHAAIFRLQKYLEERQ